MNKEELYKIALSNVHRYSLLNEIFAIRDERFPKEQQDNMLCVNGYIGIDTLSRYVRYIDELVEYQNIDTIENLKEKKEENDRLNNVISELEKWLIEYRTFIDIPDYYEEGIIDCIDDTLNKLKELKEKE